MSTQNSDELDHKLLLLFQRMSVCAATHQGSDAEWIDGQCVTPSSAAKEAKQLINQEALALLDRLENSLENTPLAYAEEAGDERNAWNTASVYEAVEAERRWYAGK